MSVSTIYSSFTPGSNSLKKYHIKREDFWKRTRNRSDIIRKTPDSMEDPLPSERTCNLLQQLATAWSLELITASEMPQSLIWMKPFRSISVK